MPCRRTARVGRRRFA